MFLLGDGCGLVGVEVDEFELSVGAFDDGGGVFLEVAAVDVGDVIEGFDGGCVDVSTDDAVAAFVGGVESDEVFEVV